MTKKAARDTILIEEYDPTLSALWCSLSDQEREQALLKMASLLRGSRRRLEQLLAEAASQRAHVPPLTPSPRGGEGEVGAP